MPTASVVRGVGVAAPGRRSADTRRAATRRVAPRRTAPPGSDALAGAVRALDLVRRLAWVPDRAAQPGGPTVIPDVQFDLDRSVPAPAVVDGVEVRFEPVHTVFVTAVLGGVPTRRDQRVLADALDAVECAYPWGPGGCVTHVAYGLPYLRRLPPGLVALHLPRLLADNDRYVLEEAVPAPGDVHPDNPGVRKRRFHLPVRIERNDLLVTLRADDPRYLRDVLRWLGGSGVLAGVALPSPRLDAGLRITSARVMFSQPGLPRLVAAARRMPSRCLVLPRASTWTAGAPAGPASPAADATFGGTLGSHLTTAGPGDYFDNGAIQQLVHDILDFRGPADGDVPENGGDDASYLERIKYIFRTSPPGYSDLWPPAGAHGRHRLGHAACRTPRPDGRPHRLDGAGFDPLDVPDGSAQPKRQSSVFQPTSAQVNAFEEGDPAAESTATRRQNFLVPPRRHRAFPLLELA